MLVQGFPKKRGENDIVLWWESQMEDYDEHNVSGEDTSAG